MRQGSYIRTYRPTRGGGSRGRRWLAGRTLNILRLAKAAFTFAGGADYVAWKIERHAGIRLELSAWQRGHPLLAAPALLLQLRRRRRPAA